MESAVLDPFGDFHTRGYLRNVYGEQSLAIVERLQTAAFEQEVLAAVRLLRKAPTLSYQQILHTHELFFGSLYPWAGSDRPVTAPHLAIAKAGYATLFAHPQDVQRAAEYALIRGDDVSFLRQHAGEVFGYLAHSHPLLEGNGRTILRIFAEMTRRAGFFIEWEAIAKETFLQALTDELLAPGRGILDALIHCYQRDGALSPAVTARRLRLNFNSTVRNTAQ